MPTKAAQDDDDALATVIDALKDRDENAIRRILRTAATFFEVEPTNSVVQRSYIASNGENPSRSSPLARHDQIFSEHSDLSPKQFLDEKQPRSDVERVACLAYYLAHFRDTPHFRTIDISKLNTEAAQFKFSNAAVSVNNASSRGLLTAAGKGFKQISALGEKFVAALPDREAAKKILESIRSRRGRTRSRPQTKPKQSEAKKSQR